jgi:hypothetical protein
VSLASHRPAPQGPARKPPCSGRGRDGIGQLEQVAPIMR